DQRWGNAEVLNYRRPLYRFVQVSLPEMKVQLQSPQEVIEMIEKHQDFDPSLLNDISIGYQLEEGIGDNQQQDTDKTEYDSNSVT
ncbi:two-component system activity regulator YycH, partial [Escherichia coli]|nr:two-component system activity regulator YycH [Escherichia coli]